MNKILCIACLLTISGCIDSASEPSNSWTEASQGVYAGAISSTAELNIIGSLNHGASLWRTRSNERIFSWNHKSGEFSDLVAAGFSPDGSRAVTTDPRTLVLWDTDTGRALQYWATPASVLDIAVAADGHQVLMGLEDHSAVLFDALTGTHINTLLHEGRVYSVDLSLNSRYALTGSEDATAKLWDLADGSVKYTFDHENPVRIVALSPNAKLAFSAAQGQKLVLWDLNSGTQLHVFEERNPGVTSARFSPDGQLLLIGFVHRRVELWNTTSLTMIKSWQLKPKQFWQSTGAAVLELGFDSSQNNYYALSGDGQISELQ